MTQTRKLTGDCVTGCCGSNLPIRSRPAMAAHGGKPEAQSRSTELPLSAENGQFCAGDFNSGTVKFCPEYPLPRRPRAPFGKDCIDTDGRALFQECPKAMDAAGPRDLL